MLQNAYFLAKIGADTAENEQHSAEILPIRPCEPACMSDGTAAAAAEAARLAGQVARRQVRALLSPKSRENEFLQIRQHSADDFSPKGEEEKEDANEKERRK